MWEILTQQRPYQGTVYIIPNYATFHKFLHKIVMLHLPFNPRGKKIKQMNSIKQTNCNLWKIC